MAKSKKDFTLLLMALFCSSLAHAQKQVPAERKDSIDNGIFPFCRNLLLCMSQRTAKERHEK